MDIFSNPLIKNVALKQIKSLMKENNLKAIVLIQDNTGEIQFELLKENPIEETENLKKQIEALENSINILIKE